MHVLLPVKFLPLPYKNTLNRFICACINVTPAVATINTFHARLIQAFRVKTACSHVALHEHNSGVESPRELFKGSKDSASLVVCNDKKFSVLGFGFFVSDVIRGGLLGHFGPLSSGPGPKPLDGGILLKFGILLKLGLYPSLLILWMTCWGFEFKSYNLK